MWNDVILLSMISLNKRLLTPLLPPLPAPVLLDDEEAEADADAACSSRYSMM